MGVRPSASRVGAWALASCVLAVSAAALAAEGDRDARVNTLILDLFSKDKAARLRAISALGAQGGPRAVEALANVLREGDAAMRVAAVDALAASGAGGSQVLADQLGKVEAAFRLRIVAAVAAAARPDAVVPLKVALKDDSPAVRAAAALALARLAPDGAAEMLKPMQTDADAGVRSGVRWALLALGGGRMARADKALAARVKGKPVTLDLEESTLDSVLEFLADIWGASLFVDWRALREAGLGRGGAVTYRGRLSGARAMDTVLLHSCGPGADWLIDGFVLRVATPEVLLALLDRPAAVPVLEPDNDPKAARATLKTLDKTVSKLEFVELDIELGLEFMAEYSDLNFLVRWDALKAATVRRDTVFSIHLADLPFGKGLELMLDSAAGTGRCAYAVCGWTVVVSTPADLASLRKRTWPKGLSAAEGIIQVGLKAHLARGKPGADSESNPLTWFAKRGEMATIGRILGGLDAKQRAAACSDVLPAAVSQDRIMMAGFLLDQGADIETRDSGLGSLHIAAEGGRLKLASLLISRGANVNAPSRRGTPLTRARAALAWQEGELKTARDEKKKKVHEANIVTFNRIIELLRENGATDTPAKPAP